jgi:hypothetical protein
MGRGFSKGCCPKAPTKSGGFFINPLIVKKFCPACKTTQYFKKLLILKLPLPAGICFFVNSTIYLLAQFFPSKCAVTVWLCIVRDIETVPFQTCTEPIRLFLFCFYRQIVKDELAMLPRRTAV